MFGVRDEATTAFCKVVIVTTDKSTTIDDYIKHVLPYHLSTRRHSARGKHFLRKKEGKKRGKGKRGRDFKRIHGLLVIVGLAYLRSLRGPWFPHSLKTDAMKTTR
jgi:hypothetical protein